MALWRNTAIAGLLLLMGAAAAVSDFQRGLDMINARDYRGAITAYNTDIANRPNNSPSYHNRGLAYYGLGELGPAEADFRRATSLSPNYNGWLQLGRVLGDAKKYDEAITTLNRAIALDATRPEPHLKIGDIQLEQKKNAEALAAYQKAAGLAPTNLSAAGGQVDALVALNRRDEARAVYDKFLTAEPANYAVLIGRGALDYNVKLYSSAAAFYLRATQANASNAQGHSYLADAYAGLGRNAEARTAYQRALSLEPRRVDTLKGLAAVLVKLNDPAGARNQIATLKAVDAAQGAELELSLFPPTYTAVQVMECAPTEPTNLASLFTRTGADDDEDYDLVRYAVGTHRPFGLQPVGSFEDMEDFFWEERVLTLYFNQPYASVRTAVLNRFGVSRCDSEGTGNPSCTLNARTTGPAAQQHGQLMIDVSGQRTRVECVYG